MGSSGTNGGMSARVAAGNADDGCGAEDSSAAAEHALGEESLDFSLLPCGRLDTIDPRFFFEAAVRRATHSSFRTDGAIADAVPIASTRSASEA